MAPLPRSARWREDLESLAEKMRTAYGWDSPRKLFQLEAVKAQLEGVDMIVQAPTGAGKTAIAAGPHLWPGNEKKFTIMVCPLLSLEEEMEKTFKTDFGLKAVAINTANGGCSPLKIKDILAHKYQVILISPEMLQSRMFMDRVLRNTHFMRHMLSMFIDEAHCISHWGADFRKKYGTLGKLRAFFPRGTPVIAVTATLTARVRRTIHSVLLFAQSTAQSRFINAGNDRPNVSIVARACEHPLNSYADLQFLIPPNVNDLRDIPKTYLYVDNIPVGGEIVDYIGDQLEAAAHPDLLSSCAPLGSLREVIRPFNANLSQEYRTEAMERFRAGDVRVLVCTDAAGMGCNMPDIDRVVQWKLPATFSHFIQRAGRAARGKGRQGVAILLVERSAYNTDLVSEPSMPPPSLPNTTKSSKSASKKKAVTTAKRDPKDVREYAVAHGVNRGNSRKEDDLPEGEQPRLDLERPDESLLTFVQSTTCRRGIWAKVFESPVCAPTVPCCDICNPELLNLARPVGIPPESKPRQPKKGLPDVAARARFRGWRKEVYDREHADAMYDDEAVLDDEFIAALDSIGSLSRNYISSVLKGKWPFWDEHAEELISFTQTFSIDFIPIPPKPRSRQSSASEPPDPTFPKSTPRMVFYKVRVHLLRYS
ncbi:P-loop containing nucleoside triphosphate hydrolase protein [Ganoderma leucocontextum]|nr:P-loop containing nucleoside triphosphate hydrolase protein [Ganoderma leucocontextum]